MQIVRADAFGPPEVMKLVEMEPPPLQPGEIRVAVAVCGVNRADVLQRSGKWHVLQLPVFPGREAAGVVSEVAPGVVDFRPGQRVLVMRGRPGCYATEVAAPAAKALPLPDGMDLAEAVALPTSWLTAWYSLLRLARVAPGETVLVQGAASAVGHAAVQIARWKGARVLGSAGSAEKCAWIRELGAEEGIDYSRDDVAAAVARITGGRGVDVVLDAVGGRAFPSSLKALAYGGRCVALANVTTEDSVVNTRDFYPKNAVILGFHLGYLMEKGGWDPRPDVSELLQAVAARHLRVHVDRAFPLRDAAAAHRYLEERRNRGNVVLVTG